MTKVLLNNLKFGCFQKDQNFIFLLFISTDFKEKYENNWKTSREFHIIYTYRKTHKSLWVFGALRGKRKVPKREEESRTRVGALFSTGPITKGGTK